VDEGDWLASPSTRAERGRLSSAGSRTRVAYVFTVAADTITAINRVADRERLRTSSRSSSRSRT
jgi:hypothetical protein